MTRTGSPEQEAWHEAGHAVVAHLLLGEVREVTLESDDDSFGGRVTVAWPGCSAARAAERSARAALAGPLAELGQYEQELDLESAEIRAAWSGDWGEVERCATLCEPDPERRTALIERWFLETRALVDQEETQTIIARVADALDAHGTLDATLFEDCL